MLTFSWLEVLAFSGDGALLDLIQMDFQDQMGTALYFPYPGPDSNVEPYNRVKPSP